MSAATQSKIRGNKKQKPGKKIQKTPKHTTNMKRMESALTEKTEQTAVEVRKEDACLFKTVETYGVDRKMLCRS